MFYVDDLRFVERDEMLLSYLVQVQLQLVLDLDGLGDAARERAVGVAPLVPYLRRARVDQVFRVYQGV